MQKLDIRQSIGSRLSVKQIQFIKLLQTPGYKLSARIQQEISDNPLLEEDYPNQEDEKKDDEDAENEKNEDEDTIIDEYIRQDEFSGYKMEGDGFISNHEDREMPIPKLDSYIESLNKQLGLITLDENDYIVGKQIIGSIDQNGYMSRNMKTIINDLALLYGIEVKQKKVEAILKKVQEFDPPGVGARDLKECLLIQLKQISNNPYKKLAIKILNDCFEEFIKKHYDKIQKKLSISEKNLKNANDLIIKLNPKPIQNQTDLESEQQYLKPDFIIKETKTGFMVDLIDDDILSLKINNFYLNILKKYKQNKSVDNKTKETVTFIKQKLDSAKSFIESINQRRQTLIKSMKAIIDFQEDFFKTGDFQMLQPMILKDVADVIEMDISTVSRVVSSKSVQTKFGIFMLKQFFSETIETVDGKLVSNKKVKQILKNLVNEEDKKKPYSDEQVEILLKKQGFLIARRTVAKYREQLKIPVARLRKKL